MPTNYDLTLDGEGYMLAPASGTGAGGAAYRYAVEAAAPAPVRTGIPFFAAPAADTDATRWWSLGLLPEAPSLGGAGGLTLAPALRTVSASIPAPTTTNARSAVYRGAVYLAVGSSLSRVTTTASGGRQVCNGVTYIGAATGAILGMAVVNDLLVMACAAPATTLVAYNGATFSNSPTATGAAVWGYANALWLASRDYPAIIQATQDGGVTWSYWVLDAAVRSALPTGDACYVGTAGAIWRIAGRFTTTTMGSTTVTTFAGSVAPLVALSGGGGADDLAWLVSYRGEVYTWAGGTVQRLAGSGASARLVPVPEAPRGTSLGACVAGDHLLVCWAATGGPLGTGSGVAAWNGSRWAVLYWSASVVPCAPVGTGGLPEDAHALTFIAGSAAVGCLEFPVREPTRNPAASGAVVCGPWEASATGRAKTWAAVSAAWSLVPGAAANPGGTFALATSSDDGAMWVAAGSATIAAGETAGIARFALSGVSAARLRVRLTWTPTATYAGWRLTGVWADGVAMPATAAGETWTARVRCADRLTRRDGSIETARTGAQMRATLATLAASGRAVTLRDLDDDLRPTTRTVRLLALSESTRRGDGAHFWESEVTLTLVSS